MLLTLNNIEIPKEWEHDPLLKNNNNQTIAFIYAI